MDEHGLARAVGWVSLGLGLALVASPARTVKRLGMSERPNLGRLLGARDLVLGAGLLRGQSEATWLRARGWRTPWTRRSSWAACPSALFRRAEPPLASPAPRASPT